MSRSLKKGPYIAVTLEKKIIAMNESVQGFNDIPGFCGAHHCCP